MCAGAILHARIPKVVYAAPDPKGGAMGGLCDLNEIPFNHHPAVESGLLEAEAGALLQEFFQNLRLTLRSRPKWRRPASTQKEDPHDP